MKKIFLTPGIIVLALAGLMSTVFVGNAFADSHSKQESKGFFGEVTNATEDSVTLLLKNGETVVVAAPAEKHFDFGEGEVEGFGAVPIGSRVAVLAFVNADGQWELKKGRTIPAKTAVLHRTFTVINVTGDTVVAQDAETGAEVIVELRFEPGVDLTGQEVTFIGRQIEAGRFVATRAITLSKVVERLRVHVEKERSAEEGRGDAARRRVQAQKLAALKNRLGRHVTKQIDRLTQLLVESPEEAKAELHKVQDNIKKHLRAALAVLDKTPEEVDRVLHRRVINALVVEGGVNVEDNHITLLTQGHAKVIVAVVDGTQIQIGKEPATIEDVRGGDHVRVRFDRESGDVASIEIQQLASAKGLVDSVDFENGSITFRLPDSGRLTLTVSEVGKVQVNGHLVPLESLSLDTAVHLSYNPRTQQLLRIEAKERSEHTITVETIDKLTRTIVGSTDDGREVRLRLAANARLEAGNIRGSINALRVGARVTAIADRATDQVVNLREHVSDHRQGEVVIRGRFTGVRIDINTEMDPVSWTESKRS